MKYLRYLFIYLFDQVYVNKQFLPFSTWIQRDNSQTVLYNVT